MRVTKIEKLGAENPELRHDVRLMFDRKESRKSVQGMLQEKYNVKVSQVAVGHYEEKFEEELARVREEKQRYLALADIIGEKGLDVAAQAKLWEATKVMTPQQLLKLVQVGHERDKLKLATQELANRTAGLEAKLKQAQGGGTGEGEPGSAVTEEARQEVLRNVREIFGLSPDPDEPADTPVEGGGDQNRAEAPLTDQPSAPSENAASGPEGAQRE